MLGVLPFAFYWLIVFLVWSLMVGVPLSIAAKINHQLLPIRPFRYFLLALVLLFTLGLLLGGSALRACLIMGESPTKAHFCLYILRFFQNPGLLEIYSDLFEQEGERSVCPSWLT